jgi:hypothetical protein
MSGPLEQGGVVWAPLEAADITLHKLIQLNPDSNKCLEKIVVHPAA